MRWLNRRPNVLAVQALDIRTDDQILELGFGPGYAIARMAALAPEGIIYGIDQSVEMLAQAEARNRRAIHDRRVRLSLGRFEDLAFPDASLDKILAVNVAYFWEDVSRVVREVRRVLKPGGRMAVYVTGKRDMRNWKFAGAKTHRLFDRTDLERALGEGGFAAAEIEVQAVRIGFGVSGLIATAPRRHSAPISAQGFAHPDQAPWSASQVF